MGITWPWAEISVSGAGVLLRLVVVRLEGVWDWRDEALALRRALEMGDEEERGRRQAVVVLLAKARKSMAMASKGLQWRRLIEEEDDDCDGRGCCGSKDEDNLDCCLCATKDLLSSSIYFAVSGPGHARLCVVCGVYVG